MAAPDKISLALPACMGLVVAAFLLRAVGGATDNSAFTIAAIVCSVGAVALLVIIGRAMRRQ